MENRIFDERHTQEELGETGSEIERTIEEEIWPRVNRLMEDLGFNEVDVDFEADMRADGVSACPFRSKESQEITIGSLPPSITVEAAIVHERTHIEINSYFFELVEYIEEKNSRKSILHSVNYSNREDFRYSALWNRRPDRFRTLVESPIPDRIPPQESELIQELEEEMENSGIRKPFDIDHYHEGFCDSIMLLASVGDNRDIWRDYWESNEGYNGNKEVVKITEQMHDKYSNFDGNKYESLEEAIKLMEDFYLEGRL